jgi:hypothetical protein
MPTVGSRERSIKRERESTHDAIDYISKLQLVDARKKHKKDLIIWRKSKISPYDLKRMFTGLENEPDTFRTRNAIVHMWILLRSKRRWGFHVYRRTIPPEAVVVGTYNALLELTEDDTVEGP